MTEKIVNKGFKIRIYPTDEQKTIIEKTFGCCRFIYNNYLQEKNEFYNERVEKTYESLVHRMNRLKSFPLTILE